MRAIQRGRGLDFIAFRVFPLELLLFFGMSRGLGDAGVSGSGIERSVERWLRDKYDTLHRRSSFRALEYSALIAI